jgi:hypothetical protein
MIQTGTDRDPAQEAPPEKYEADQGEEERPDEKAL